LNIVVCIKQVPASSDVKVDPVTGVLIRSGSNSKMNPYDLYSIETALKIKEMHQDVKITVLSMGPGQAKEVLKEALWMGCDEAVLLSDRKFAGADVLATSRALSQAIIELGHVDLIICGKQTTDGDTAQVGPEIAEFLGFPQATYVNEIKEIKADSIVLSTNYENHYEVLEVMYPCLITVDKDIYTPRLPSYKRGLSFKDYVIKTLTMNDLSVNDESIYGLNGSPTQVERIFSPDKNKEKVVVEGTEDTVTNTLFSALKAKKFF
jgi:electron transfer flavoprotein beta subunit